MEQNYYLDSKEIKYIHFIGIDGISMSGLAEILIDMGYKISGSDMKTSHRTEKLSRMGAKIFPFHSEQNITDPHLIVYTAAIKGSNPEMVKAKSLGIPMIDRATLLGQIMKRYPFSIAVSGTHGKTTTTSMVSMIMMEAGMDPTLHIGAELQSIGGTTRIGASKFFVAEACEYTGSFLKFNPYIAIILNVDFDHADYFRDIAHVKDTFLEFALRVPEDGYIVACSDDSNTMSLLDSIHCNKVTFGLNATHAMWTAENISFDDLGCPSFTLIHNRELLGDIKLGVTGVHNINNALAAIASCHIFGCSIQSIRQGLHNFKGAGRRFELKGLVNDIKVLDDYAHHPLEVRATLKAARNCRFKKLWCIFQPHTYTRTKALMEEFADSFHDADHAIITDIYAAREADTGEVHARMLAEAANRQSGNTVYISGFDEIAAYLENNVSSGDMVITMGAGDVYRIGEMFLEKISASVGVK